MGMMHVLFVAEYANTRPSKMHQQASAGLLSARSCALRTPDVHIAPRWHEALAKLDPATHCHAPADSLKCVWQLRSKATCMIVLRRDICRDITLKYRCIHCRLKVD